MMLNHRISKMHTSETRGAMHAIFSWYLLGIKYGFIIDDKKIQAAHFINLFAIALEIKQMEKLHDLFDKVFEKEETIISHINNFTNKNNEKQMEEAKIICEAYVHFHNKNFEDCRVIYGRNFKIFNFAVIAYRQLVKANMEIYLKNNTDILVLKSSIEAFKKYLHRNENRLAKKRLLLNKNFLKNLNIILKNNEESINLEKLKIEITNTPYVSSKWWFVDKIEELMEHKIII